ncbi:uncharacterized protein LOC111710834 [Eurytemora carolleeae]|uniref:uncharacterized protein LOC111710834 n=1 Tax=Eurytemora carolleeae TaxID=1294199 RepID=UPI000C76A97E|nr:uncharacterized protein LOC111710834 [Eurytemora carolleeae]|eukprot:XP_023340762.1 uncharacterized protein LOC111710834 [Eurytemora affinis]
MSHWLRDLLVLNQIFINIYALKCFQCTEHRQVPVLTCPKSTDNSAVWAADSSKYVDVGDSAVTSCAIRITGSGSVMHQGGVPKSTCSDSSSISYILQLVNSDSGSSGSQFVCCSTDGCNWSLSSAKNNLVLGSSTVVDTAFVPYLVGILLAFLLLGLLLLCLCSGACASCACCAACAAGGCLNGGTKEEDKIKESAKSRAKTEHININDRYKVIMKPERTLTPVGEREVGGSAPSPA